MRGLLLKLQLLTICIYIVGKKKPPSRAYHTLAYLIIKLLYDNRRSSKYAFPPSQLEFISNEKVFYCLLVPV